MQNIDSPASPFAMLTDLFPPFADEFRGEQPTSYHQVSQHVTPVVTGYLREAQKQTTVAFCNIVNAMVSAGGEKENANLYLVC
jgi:hypothetical protein